MSLLNILFVFKHKKIILQIIIKRNLSNFFSKTFWRNFLSWKLEFQVCLGKFNLIFSTSHLFSFLATHALVRIVIKDVDNVLTKLYLIVIILKKTHLSPQQMKVLGRSRGIYYMPVDIISVHSIFFRIAHLQKSLHPT